MRAWDCQNVGILRHDGAAAAGAEPALVAGGQSVVIDIERLEAEAAGEAALNLRLDGMRVGIAHVGFQRSRSSWGWGGGGRRRLAAGRAARPGLGLIVPGRLRRCSMPSRCSRLLPCVADVSQAREVFFINSRSRVKVHCCMRSSAQLCGSMTTMDREVCRCPGSGHVYRGVRQEVVRCQARLGSA